MFFDWFDFMLWLIGALSIGLVVGIMLTMFQYYYWDLHDNRKLRVSRRKFLWENIILVIFPAFLLLCVVSFIYLSTTTFRDAPLVGVTQNVEN